jgi:tetratricopeptide repeat protein 21B
MVTFVNQGNPTVAIQELANLEDKRDFPLVCNIAMINAHKKCKYVDQEAIEAINAKVTILLSNQTISERAYSIVGWYYLFVQNLVFAQEYFSKAIALNPNSLSALNGAAWIEMIQNESKANPFEKSIRISDRDVESLLGHCYYFRSQKRFAEATDTIHRIVGYYPSFVPALIEKLSVQLESQNWDGLLDNAQRLGGIAPDNVDSMLMIALYECCWEGPSDTVATFLETTKKVHDSHLVD